MHYSGILVRVRPEELGQAVAALEALAGVEVRHTHLESGRIVVVQEAASESEQAAGLRRIQSLPTVELAALVVHHIDREATELKEEHVDEE